MNQEDHGTKKIFGILLPDWMDEKVLKKMVYSFLGLVVALIMSSIFIWPRFTELYVSEKKLKDLKESLTTLSSSVDQVENFKLVFGEDELSTIGLAMPIGFDPGLILSSLRQIGVRSGVVLNAYELEGGFINVDEVKLDSDSGQIKTMKHKVVLKLVGKSEDLIRFTDLLGSSLPFSVISELSLSEVSTLLNKQGVSQLEMEVAYFESQPVKVKLDRIPDLVAENKELFDEIHLYTKPLNNLGIENAVFENRESLFGF